MEEKPNDLTISWSSVPLEVLAQSLAHLYPNFLSSLACAQATCHRFHQAAHEVVIFLVYLSFRGWTLEICSFVVVQALKDVEEVRYLPRESGTGSRCSKQRWLVQNITKLKRFWCCNGNLFSIPKPSEWLSSCHLVELHLPYCSVSDAEMVSFLSRTNHQVCALPFLQVLVLDSSEAYLSGKGWAVKELLPSLQVLSLAWCYGIEGKWLACIARQLTHVNVHGCEAVGDEVCLALGCAVDLDIAMTRTTDIGLRACASLESLQKLTISRDHENVWVSRHWSLQTLENLRLSRPDIEIQFSSC